LALRQRQPEAELSVVVGSWLEGETRSGNAWPDVPRAYVDQWLARCVALREEQSASSHSTSSNRTMLTICAEERSAGEYLIDLAQSLELGVRLHDWTQPTGTREAIPQNTRHLVVYDAASSPEYRNERLEQLVQAYPETGVIVLIGFPREREVAELTALGAAAVLGKPFLIDDLCRYLNASADINSAVRAA
ncbi:MAG: hypothetical protein KDB23_09565, partial [Planctomycetales bacterium]|nr:hypothetical protein [Planctomycetales bacterium]